MFCTTLEFSSARKCGKTCITLTTCAFAFPFILCGNDLNSAFILSMQQQKLYMLCVQNQNYKLLSFR